MKVDVGFNKHRAARTLCALLMYHSLFPLCWLCCNSYEIDPTRELVALGIANIGGGIFSTLPSQAPLSRSAVNAATGAKSQVALLVRLAWPYVLRRN
jgi:MFS superfamily sulfate permease-like transporter